MCTCLYPFVRLHVPSTERKIIFTTLYLLTLDGPFVPEDYILHVLYMNVCTTHYWANEIESTITQLLSISNTTFLMFGSAQQTSTKVPSH